MDRLATFRRFTETRPDDPFPRYSLAMELRGQGDIDGAIAEFDTLIARFPDYVPTYLMAGTTLAKAGHRPRARGVMTAGIEAARRKGGSACAERARGRARGARCRARPRAWRRGRRRRQRSRARTIRLTIRLT